MTAALGFALVDTDGKPAPLQGDSLSLAEATRRVLGVTEPVLRGMVQWKGTKRNPAQPVSAEADDRRSKSLIWWWPRGDSNTRHAV